MTYDKKFNKCEHRILVFRITASFSKTTMIFFDCIAKHFTISLSEPVHIKTNKMTRAPSYDSDQPWHPSSLIRVFIAVHMRNLGFSDTH